MAHHTKDKGDLGVLKAQADMASQGFMILLPLTEHSPFDLVIYKNQKFLRVQVKYRTCNTRGCLDIALQSIWSDKQGVHRTSMDKNDVDIICIYCPDTDSCYYFDPKIVKRESISLRMNPSKNNQHKRVRLAEDFRRII